MFTTQAPPASRRREKPQLSCNLCRSRKLRCDRQKPCGTCTTHGRSATCHYPDNVSPPLSKRTTTPSTLQGRINRLEGLVVQLMEKSAAIPATEARLCAKCSDPLPDISPPASSEHASAGKLHLDASKTAYVSNAHWKAVLEEISELKIISDGQGDEDEAPSPAEKANYGLEDSILIPGTTRERPRLLYGWHKPASINEILAAMPERAVADRLVLAYFHNPPIPHRQYIISIFLVVILHASSFLRQYEMFWADPFNTPLTWIALLYGIMCLTTQADNFRNLVIENSTSPSTPIPSLPPSRPKYLDQVEQSLIAGNYSNGGPFALEALLHYHVIEHTRYPDADVGTWLLTGMITRLGLRMGYHRDPSHFPNISPFQGEIRRRVWVLIHALDVMMSLQLGLPRVIKDGHWDTIPPRNLYDSEFDEDTLELPPSRPENEATPTLHLIAKHKLLVVIGTIADTSMMTTEQGSPSALAAEKRLTARLREAYESAPPHVKFDPISRFLTNNASEIMNRLSTTLLLQKGLIVLNWHHVMPRGSTPGLNFDLLTSGHEKTNEEDEGYRVCIEASLEILKLQEIVDYETQPGGMLFTLHLLLYSVVKHEFLMAATVLITHMFRTIASHSESQVVHENKMLDQEVILALRKSHGIWIRQSGRSREAMRVTNLLTMLFQKLEDLDVQQFCENATLEDFTVMQSDNAGLALFGEFGLLHHLEDLSTFMNLPAT